VQGGLLSSTAASLFRPYDQDALPRFCLHYRRRCPNSTPSSFMKALRPVPTSTEHGLTSLSSRGERVDCPQMATCGVVPSTGYTMHPLVRPPSIGPCAPATESAFPTWSFLARLVEGDADRRRSRSMHTKCLPYTPPYPGEGMLGGGLAVVY
jgi:hypothetical protein